MSDGEEPDVFGGSEIGASQIDAASSYQVTIGCQDRLTAVGRLAYSKLRMYFLPVESVPMI